MEEGGFVDVQVTINSVVDEQPASSIQDGDDDSSQDTPTPAGPEDVKTVPEEGDPPLTRRFFSQ